MEGRWFRVGAVIEWLVAAAAVLLVIWIVSVPVQRLLGPGVQAAMSEADLGQSTPPGVPAGATLVPVLLLIDGREVRQGDLHSWLDTVLPPKFSAGPPVTSTGQLGERHTRAYLINQTKIYIVCERLEPNGPIRVSGIYLP